MTRAKTVVGHCRSDVTILSSAPAPAGWPPRRWVHLPDDAHPGGGDHSAGGTLHWAPVGHAGFARRMRSIARWVDDHDPDLLVIDVSVEVALLTRLLGVPLVVTLMAGDRSDRAHQAAYDAATVLVAAWPKAVGPAPVGGWQERWEPKTHWVGGLSRFDGRVTVDAPGDGTALILGGKGGCRRSALSLPEVPGWRWRTPTGSSPNEVWASLQDADVVVTHAGQNALAEVAAARRPAVVIADDRPHAEQDHLARAVASVGCAVVAAGRPGPEDWPGLLERARQLGGRRWAAWSDGLGSERYAAVLDGMVGATS